jgi:hypothetical protein
LGVDNRVSDSAAIRSRLVPKLTSQADSAGLFAISSLRNETWASDGWRVGLGAVMTLRRIRSE